MIKIKSQITAAYFSAIKNRTLTLVIITEGHYCALKEPRGCQSSFNSREKKLLLNFADRLWQSNRHSFTDLLLSFQSLLVCFLLSIALNCSFKQADNDRHSTT